jgi:hypothetical protein
MSDSEKYPENKDCNFVILRKISFWERLLSIFVRNCFPYCVVYTDGLMSYRKEDLSKRTPWGILIGNEIVSIHEPNVEMTAREIDDYCSSIFFAGQCVRLPTFSTLKKIRRNIHKINALIKELGGDPFASYWYRSCESYSYLVCGWVKNDIICDKTVRTVHMGDYGMIDIRPATVFEMEPKEKSRARFTINY